MKFRVKVLLADGRFVYWSKRGVPELLTETEVEWAKHTPMGEYTKDLFWYQPEPGILFPAEMCVKVTAKSFEPESTPIDSTAFILGGGKPVTA